MRGSEWMRAGRENEEIMWCGMIEFPFSSRNQFIFNVSNGPSIFGLVCL